MSIISQGEVSALMVAAYRGHSEVVAQLLEAGANTDLQSSKVQIIIALAPDVWCNLIILLVCVCHQSGICAFHRTITSVCISFQHCTMHITDWRVTTDSGCVQWSY